MIDNIQLQSNLNYFTINAENNDKIRRRKLDFIDMFWNLFTRFEYPTAGFFYIVISGEQLKSRVLGCRCWLGCLQCII